jgi:hypothetical protein
MFSVGTPFASVEKVNDVVDSNGCEPAWVSGVPSALIVDPEKFTTHHSAPPGHDGLGGFRASALDGSRIIASDTHAAAAAPASHRRPATGEFVRWQPVCMVMLVSLLIVATYAFTVTGSVTIEDEPAVDL